MELCHPDCPSRKVCWPLSGLRLQLSPSSSLPQLQPPGPKSSLPGTACIWQWCKVGGIRDLYFSLMWANSDKQCTPQSSLPGGWGFIGLHQSSAPHSTQSCPLLLSFTDIDLNILYPMLPASREFDWQHSKKNSLCFYYIFKFNHTNTRNGHWPNSTKQY